MCFIFLAFRVYRLAKKKDCKIKTEPNQFHCGEKIPMQSRFVLFKFEQLSECLQDPMENLGC